MNAVIATKRKISFPITPLLDDFNRADENRSPTAPGRQQRRRSTGQLAVISNEVGQSRRGGSWWDENWEDCGEAYVTHELHTSLTAVTAPLLWPR